jgi:hypothetical protein
MFGLRSLTSAFRGIHLQQKIPLNFASSIVPSGYVYMNIRIVKFLDKYAELIRPFKCFRDAYNMTNYECMYIIRNTHSILHIKYNIYIYIYINIYI